MSHVHYEKATLAGGCFWCMMAPFENLNGVIKVTAGYTGGQLENPTYEEVCTGVSGHIEAIQVTYDANQVTYQQLLDLFWQQIDPTDEGGQFADRGTQYQTAIFYHDETQHREALESRIALAQSGRFNKPIATLIRPAAPFYLAEAYHQDYHIKNKVQYQSYRYRSGRDTFLNETWGQKNKR